MLPPPSETVKCVFQQLFVKKGHYSVYVCTIYLTAIVDPQKRRVAPPQKISAYTPAVNHLFYQLEPFTACCL